MSSKAAAERLEDRSLLSVAALFVNGELFVSSDAGDRIAIRQNATSGNVEVVANGSVLGTAPNVSTSSITSIVVKGGDDANMIDLNLVTNVTFPSLSVTTASIRVDGGNGDDTILGSPTNPDSLLGGDGNDVINGQGGSDTVDGGNGRDSITGDIGDDSLIGGDGSDTINGDAGNDIISGGSHADSINGGAGADNIDAGQSNDTVFGGSENDTINGGDGQDSLSGDAGNDSILGGADIDVISGGADNDVVSGQSGNDTVSGNDGDDQVLGGAGNDSVSGDLSNDTVNGEAGDDIVNGNEGNDSLYGGNGNDVLRGDGTDLLAAAAGNDRLFGQGGNDTLLGAGGADTIDGGTGNDSVDSSDPIPEATPVTIFASAVNVAEGNAGTANLNFTLTLSQASFLPVSVTVQTQDGSANAAGADYTTLNPTVVTFAPGTTTLTVAVPVTGDATSEPNETVRLLLSAPTNGARLLNQEVSGTITNDDAPVIGLFATAGQFGATLFQINAATATATPVGGTGLGVIDITQDATGTIIAYDNSSFFNDALVGLDANTAATTGFTFVNGITLPIEGDIAFDSTNNLIYGVTSGVGNPNLFRIDPATGVGTDLGEIQVAAANLAGAATDNISFDYLAFNAGTLFGVISSGVTGTNANFIDALFSINPATLVATRIGGAGGLGVAIGGSGGMDFDTVAGNLVLLDGSTGNLFRINPMTGVATAVAGNTGLSGFNTATGLTFAPIPAVAPPSVTVSNAGVVVEADTGTQVVNFLVTVPATGNAVTVVVQTVDGTATAGSDYTAVPATPLNFGPFGGSQLVPVTISGDFQFEGNETFFLQVTSATGAPIGVGSGVATITNNDVAPLGDTLLGNAGNDTLIGGPSDDFINSEAGNDVVFGNGGNDTLLGGSSGDTLDGGDGNDSLDGQGGVDVLISGAGDDIFVWQGSVSGSDTFSNSSGADAVQVTLNASANVVSITQSAPPVDGTFGLIRVTDGAATLTIDSSISQVTVNGGDGADTITIGDLDKASRSAIVVQGGAGNDVLSALNAKTGLIRLRMEGGDGNDIIIGGVGNDTLVGGAGVDRVKGGEGNDQLEGGTGADSINGENGNDTLLGGDSNDTLAGDGADSLNGDAGNDLIRGGLGNDLLNGGTGNDSVRGGDGDDTANGGDGTDTLEGESGLDSLSGDAGNDTLDGGRNNDVLNGGDGNDKLRGDHGDDTINAGLGDDTASGGDGNDVISGGDGNDVLGAFDGDDVVTGGAGNDVISGGDGDDVLLGGGGSDVVLGDQGDDQVNGQGSSNTIAGGQGDDTLFGALTDIHENFVLSAELMTALNAN